jgi:predicted amidohydrolase
MSDSTDSLSNDSSSARVAAVAMHSVMGEPEVNLDRIEQWCRQAHAAGACFAVFPEFCVTGALSHDYEFQTARPIVALAEKLTQVRLEKICRELQMTIVVGTIESCGARFRNVVLVVGPSGYLATYAKLHLPNPAEIEWFEPGEHMVVVSSQGWTFGVAICFDIRVPELFRASAQNGAQFFLLPVGGSGGTACGIEECRTCKRDTLILLPSRAIDNALYVFYTNAAGKSGSRFFPGVALALDPDGKLIGEQLTEGMLVTEMSRDHWTACRKRNRCTIDVLRPDVYRKPLLVGSDDGTP